MSTSSPAIRFFRMPPFIVAGAIWVFDFLAIQLIHIPEPKQADVFYISYWVGDNVLPLVGYFLSVLVRANPCYMVKPSEELLWLLIGGIGGFGQMFAEIAVGGKTRELALLPSNWYHAVIVMLYIYLFASVLPILWNERGPGWAKAGVVCFGVLFVLLFMLDILLGHYAPR